MPSTLTGAASTLTGASCNKIRCGQTAPPLQLRRTQPGFGPEGQFLRRSCQAKSVGLCEKQARRRLATSAADIGPAECGLHLAAHLYGKIGFVTGDVVPRQALALGHVALEPHVVRQPERQQPLGERALGRHLLAPYAEAAFAVEDLAGLERALGGGGDVGA